jgi:hypothetical protein
MTEMSYKEFVAWETFKILMESDTKWTVLDRAHKAIEIAEILAKVSISDVKGED